MALLTVNFHSDVLGQAMTMNVILPQRATTQIGMASVDSDKCKVLYLLHGMSDDHSIWERRTSIERYVADKNMAVVMPAAHLSWYTDMAFGGRYQTFISSELPAICRSMFRQFSDRREDNFIAGLSMGGYGALKIALTNPDKYAACAGFSGAYDVYGRARSGSPYWQSIFGDAESIPGSDNDVYHLIGKVASDGGARPRVYVSCGTDDPLYRESRKAVELLEKHGYDFGWHDCPGGHEWSVWDSEVQNALEFFLSR